MRPVVDRVLFEMVRENEFAPADFNITPEGVCRLNPQMARKIVRLVAECVQVYPMYTSVQTIDALSLGVFGQLV